MVICQLVEIIFTISNKQLTMQISFEGKGEKKKGKKSALATQKLKFALELKGITIRTAQYRAHYLYEHIFISQACK